jgi:hypothetical protein
MPTEHTLTKMATTLDEIILDNLTYGGEPLLDKEGEPVLNSKGQPVRIMPASLLQAATARLKNCGVASESPSKDQQGIAERLKTLRERGVAGRIGAEGGAMPPVSMEDDAAVG